MALITCEKACFAYEGRNVIQDLDLSIERGEYLCVIGENGSGKSTLIKGLLGLLAPVRLPLRAILRMLMRAEQHPRNTADVVPLSSVTVNVTSLGAVCSTFAVGLTPASPFGPAGPVAPVSPFGPSGPCGPVAPVAPGAPSAPAGPAGPVAPVAPAGPCGPLSPFRL